jgi:alpha-galactosidase
MRYGRRIYDMDSQLQRIRTWDELARSWSAASGTRHLSDLPHGPEDEGIVVAEVMQSVVDDRKDLFVVNVMNRGGLIGNLPASAAVEVPAVVDGQGVHPIGIPDLPPGLAATLSLHSQLQVMTMQSALTGDRGLLRQTILTDPLVAATLEPDEAEALTDDLLKANAPYLPQFASSIGGTP